MSPPNVNANKSAENVFNWFHKMAENFAGKVNKNAGANELNSDELAMVQATKDFDQATKTGNNEKAYDASQKLGQLCGKQGFRKLSAQESKKFSGNYPCKRGDILGYKKP